MTPESPHPSRGPDAWERLPPPTLFRNGRFLTLHPRLGEADELLVAEGVAREAGAPRLTVDLRGRRAIPFLWDALPAEGCTVDY
ncbi:MAG: hypothetical protein ACREID_01375, partial [Planctomycetota bacterium]